jgi:hypothetical protein
MPSQVRILHPAPITMKTLTKLFIVTVLLQVVAAVLIDRIAAGNKTDSFNGIQMLGPLLFMAILLFVYFVHQIIGNKYTQFVTYCFLAAALTLDVLLVYDTYVGINR